MGLKLYRSFGIATSYKPTNKHDKLVHVKDKQLKEKRSNLYGIVCSDKRLLRLLRWRNLAVLQSQDLPTSEAQHQRDSELCGLRASKRLRTGGESRKPSGSRIEQLSLPAILCVGLGISRLCELRNLRTIRDGPTGQQLTEEVRWCRTQRSTVPNQVSSSI